MRGQAALLHYSGKVGLLKIAKLFVEYQRSRVRATVERLYKCFMMLNHVKSLIGLCFLCDYVVNGRSIAKKET